MPLHNRSFSLEYQRSINNPEEFWLEATGAVDWSKKPTRAYSDADAPLSRWFPDGEMNTCHNALDRHVAAGRGDHPALIHDSAMSGKITTYTYSELTAEVAKFADVLRSQGVGKGDRVVIYLPMIPEAAVAMLATARLGAIHSVVFGGFAASELAVRLRDVAPQAVVTTSGGLEPNKRINYLPTIHQALVKAGVPDLPVIIKRREGFAASAIEQQLTLVDWDDAMAGAEPVDPVPVKATDPLYVLYTSGTTGAPKGVVRDNGGHAVALLWTMDKLYNIHAGDVWWTASDVGWVVGHSYIVYGPLLAGVTTLMYEGKPVGTPDAGAFWRVIAQHGIKALFTAPTALRAIRKMDPEAQLLKKYDVGTLQTLFTAGERLDTDTFHWASTVLGVPVVDHWWQTETGWGIVGNPQGMGGLPIKAGSPSLPLPGYDLRIVDAMGVEVAPGEEGNIVLALPLPPGTLTTLWGNDQRYVDSYLSVFEGYYSTGDSGYRDEDGYVFVMGRTDDIINVSGHRLSTGSMEQVLGTHPAVAECAVIGVADELKGQKAVGFVVLKAGVVIDAAELERELVASVRREIGPVADFKSAVVVEALPKTRSGKILRKTMRQMADGESYTVPSTIEDATVIEYLRPILRPS